MNLNYEDEFIENPNGIPCHVLKAESVDFAKSSKGRKSTETLVIRAVGGEQIDTINSEGNVESTYVAQSGESIFYNDKKDQYVPRDSNGKAWNFEELQSYGYEIVSVCPQKPNEYGNNFAVKVKSTKQANLLVEVIVEPTCIKNAWGEGSHQFLFEGATLKQDIETGKITGIDKGAFDSTWEVLDTQKRNLESERNK